jgi:hypothetical protein
LGWLPDTTGKTPHERIDAMAQMRNLGVDIMTLAFM